MPSNYMIRAYVILLMATLWVGLFSAVRFAVSDAEPEAELTSFALVEGVDSVEVEALDGKATPAGEAEVLSDMAAPETHMPPPQKVFAQPKPVVESPAPEPKAERQVPQLPMEQFFSALDRLRHRGGKVRIAYFGDSMIEGDLITQSLRNDLQEAFGGEGVGFVPISSEIPGFRKTVRHRIGAWKAYNYFSPGVKNMELGISGELFFAEHSWAKTQSWVRYKSADVYPRTSEFRQIKMFYGKARPHKNKKPFVIVGTSAHKDTMDMEAFSKVNQLTLADSSTKEINLNFHISKDMPVYGLSMESKEGIFVDNFPSRGNSGMMLNRIPGEILSGFHKVMDYDLIVLQFGLNVVSASRKSYESYRKGMEKVVKHFQTYMPNTDILIVSVSDKSTRINGVLQTDPSVPLIVEAQRKVADDNQVGFLNLYEAMGGRNSMIRWVRSKPSLARSDYAHPNHRGAKQVAKIVREFLMEEFDSFAEQKSGNLPSSPFSMR
ncbi:MAG: hypothetical protein AAFR61_08245 [Bacteroidota bacterium]